MEKLIDKIVLWLMNIKWQKSHRATIEDEKFVIRMFSRDYYEKNIE